MNVRCFLIAVASILATLTSVAADEVISSDSVTGVKLDLRQAQVRKLDSLSDLFRIAYNSDAGWNVGGDGGSEVTILVRKAGGLDPSDVSTWVVESSCSDLGNVSGESTLEWIPVKQSLYQLEFISEDTVRETGYFNLMDTEGLSGKESIANAEIILPQSTAGYTGEPISLTGVRVRYNNQELVEGTDFAMVFFDNILIGTATATVSGIGDYKDSVSTTFQIVPNAGRTVDNGSKTAFVDLSEDDVMRISSNSKVPMLTWNTSENFVTNALGETLSCWTIGGLEAEKNAVATISYAPVTGWNVDEISGKRMPVVDDANRKVVSARSGEGLVRFHGGGGLFQLRLKVTVDGVELPGELTRVLNITSGFMILVR